MIRRATPADAEALSTLSRTCFTQTFGHLYAPADLAAFLDEAYSPTVLRAELEDPHRATWLLFEDPSDEAPASSATQAPIGYVTA
ncbi:MAG: GNAT family N-acetyltransferase, partial [Schaalia sp.]